MRRSIMWPPVAVGGRLPMTPDPEDPGQDLSVELRQVLALAIQDGRSQNPFNGSLGVDDPTFKGASDVAAAAIRASVRRRFAAFERDHRARLVDVVVGRPVESAGYARQLIAVTYEDLETGGREALEVSLV